MMNFFKRLFYPQWIILDVFYGNQYPVSSSYSETYGFVNGSHQNIFRIEYSSIRNRYRLKYNKNICNFKSSDLAYHQALAKLIEYNKSLLEK